MLMLGYRYRVVVAALLICAVVPLLSHASGDKSDSTVALPLGSVRVLNPDVGVEIDNAYLSFDVGHSLPLFQENDDYFIALADTPYEGKRLCAFRVKKGAGKSAWVTPENTMFFGYRTLSSEGKLFFRIYEELPVIRESPDSYEVLVERLGQQAAIWIPKLSDDFMFLANTAPVARVTGKKALTTKVSRTTGHLAATSSTSTTARPRATAQKRTRASVQPVASNAAPALVQPSAEDVDEALMSFLDADFDEDGAGYEEDVVASSRDAVGLVLNSLKQGTKIVIVAVASFLLFVIIVVLGLRNAVLKKSHKSRLRKLSAADQPPELPPPGEGGFEDVDEELAAAADFSGSIASMSLGAVTQFLNSDKESGTLSITENNKTAIGTVLFNEGEIVDARCENKRGADAVYELLRNKEGLFAFSREELGNFERTVEQGTISLLLDAHRIMDEEGEASGNRGKKEKPKKKAKKTTLRVKKRA